MFDYAYTMGVLRSLERKLFNTNDVERMIDAPDLETAFRVFNDTEYADDVLDVKPEEFKKALDHDLKKTRDLYFQMIDNKDLLELLFIRYDFHNIKLFFKAKFLEKDLAEFETDLGTMPAESIRKYIIEQPQTGLSDYLKQVIDKVAKEFEKDSSPHYIDSYLDKVMYDHLLKLSAKVDNDFIVKFVKLQIDLLNTKILLRAKRMDRDLNFLKEELIDNGKRQKSDFIELFSQDKNTLIKALEKYFDNKIKMILNDYEKSDSLWKLEQDFENYELNFLQETKRISEGPEVVFGYYYAKKNAIRNVRLIMTGKMNGVESKEIKERVRQLW